MEKNWRDYINYIVVGLISLVALFVIPFIGSEVGLSLVLPTTPAGWIVFCASKLLVGIISVLIFHCFTQQARINIKDNPRFVEANKLLNTIEDKTVKVKSPKEYFRGLYLSKGTTQFITAILSAFSLCQAALVFDLITFISYSITIFLGLIFGVLNMKSVEEYWTGDYYIFAHQQYNTAQNKQKETTTNDCN